MPQIVWIACLHASANTQTKVLRQQSESLIIVTSKLPLRTKFPT